jgi:hypothetical protein
VEGGVGCALAAGTDAAASEVSGIRSRGQGGAIVVWDGVRGGGWVEEGVEVNSRDKLGVAYCVDVVLI